METVFGDGRQKQTGGGRKGEGSVLERIGDFGDLIDAR